MDISNVDVKLVTGDAQEVMEQRLITLNNNVTRKTCCLDSDTLVSVYSSDSENKYKNPFNSENISKLLQHCHFSEQVKGTCNEEFGQLEYSKFCNHQHVVLKAFSKAFCFSGKTAEGICNPQFNCKL